MPKQGGALDTSCPTAYNFCVCGQRQIRAGDAQSRHREGVTRAGAAAHLARAGLDAARARAALAHGRLGGMHGRTPRCYHHIIVCGAQPIGPRLNTRLQHGWNVS